MNHHIRKREGQKSIALERIEELFKQAELNYKKKPNMSNKYVSLARKISSRTKTPISKNLKRRFCKHCGTFLVPGSNARIRLNNGKKSIFCMNCSKFTRIPYK